MTFTTPGVCPGCGKRTQLARSHGLCTACAVFQELHGPEDQGERQTTDAVALLERDASGIVSWPFAALDAMAGPMAPGNVWYVCAFSGGGKTTFMTSVIRRWLDAGVRVCVMPLELRPAEWRVGFVCQRLDIPPGDALSGRLRQREAQGDPNAKLAREQIQDEIQLWHVEDRSSQLYVAPFNVLSLSKFVATAQLAKRLGYHVIVVDHVDHVDDGTVDAASNAVAVSQMVNRELPRIAQELDLVIVATSQMNLQAASGHRLAKYEPPQVNHVWHPGVKLQSATGMIGLYRPVDTTANVDLLKQARLGEVEAHRVLKPGIMGVNAMKLRNYGAHEGRRVELAVRQGAVHDLDPQDAHAIHTGGASSRPRGWVAA